MRANIPVEADAAMENEPGAAISLRPMTSPAFEAVIVNEPVAAMSRWPDTPVDADAVTTNVPAAAESLREATSPAAEPATANEPVPATRR